MKHMDSSNYIVKARLIREKISSFNEYPFNLPAISQMDELLFHEKVTYIVGENGSGKSTLIEAIAVAFGFNAEGGSIHFNFSTRDSLSDLFKFIKIQKGIKKPHDGYFLRAESFYNVATYIEELDGTPAASRRIIESYDGHSLHEQSHGEAFFALFMNRFGGNGLYILDEPEAALSPSRQMALLSRMHELVCHDKFYINNGMVAEIKTRFEEYSKAQNDLEQYFRDTVVSEDWQVKFNSLVEPYLNRKFSPAERHKLVETLNQYGWNIKSLAPVAKQYGYKLTPAANYSTYTLAR